MRETNDEASGRGGGGQRGRGGEFIRRPLRSEGTHRYGYCYGDRAFINRSYQYVAWWRGWKPEDMFIDLAGPSSQHPSSDGDERARKGPPGREREREEREAEAGSRKSMASEAGS